MTHFCKIYRKKLERIVINLKISFRKNFCNTTFLYFPIYGAKWIIYFVGVTASISDGLFKKQFSLWLRNLLDGKCVSSKIFFNGSLHDTSDFLIRPHNYFEPCYIEIVVNLNKFFAGYTFGPVTESEISY